MQGLPDYDKLQSIYDLPCGGCLGGRFPKFPHTNLSDKPDKPCALLYADTIGPYPTSYNGKTVALCVIDAYSGYSMTVPLKSKESSEILPALKTCIERFQMLAHAPVLELRTDFGTEFHNEAVHEYLASKHIKLSHSTPYIHQQVGMVERFNRSVLEICRSLLAHAKRDHRL